MQLPEDSVLSNIHSLPRSGQSNHAFTLVELLVVIAIIAILIAILLPVLSGVRSESQLVNCASNVRQQLQAHAVYANTHRDHKPPLWRRSTVGTLTVWSDFVSPNTKTSGTAVGQGILVDQKLITFEALLCPSDDMREDGARDLRNWKVAFNSGSSYVYFWQHPDDVAGRIPPDYPRGATYQRQRNNKRFALVMDVNAETGHNYTGEYAGRPWVSHSIPKRLNVGYTDGSVVTASISEVQLKFPALTQDELRWFADADKSRR